MLIEVERDAFVAPDVSNSLEENAHALFATELAFEEVSGRHTFGRESGLQLERAKS